MRSAVFAAVAALSAVASARPGSGAVTADITPTGAYPAGCTGTYDGTFELSVINASTVASRKMKAKRQVSDSLVISLTDGVLKDSKGRTGYIAANQQFQFDDPPQAGAIYTGGFSVCANSSLALGSSAIWYECLSGTFYNLYEFSQGAQCYGILLDTIKAAASSSVAGSAGVSTDGQITATSAASAVTQISDGQPQASSAASYTTHAVVSQITDGQIQATTATAAVVSQITDGQIQATTATAAVVSQITDGQIQATTAAPHTSSVAVVSQISDGQIQATTSAAAVVSQISDGQIQATTAANATSTALAVYTGAAAMPTVAPFFLAAAGLAAALL